MLFGIVFQVGTVYIFLVGSASFNQCPHLSAVIIVFVTFSVEFVVRYFQDKPADYVIHEASTGRGALNTSTRMMLYVVAFNTLVLFIRYASRHTASRAMI